MEMHPDVVVHSLKILIDPADGSYAPSLLIVSTGDSLSGLKEISAVAVGLQVIRFIFLFCFEKLLFKKKLPF